MKTRTFLAAFCGSLVISLARAQDAAPAATAESYTQLPAQAAPAFSGRVNDVVTLVQSGVDESVVLSYIKASPGPFTPDANEIVKVRNAGVSPTVINAMLQRGNELRQEEAQNQTAQVASTTYAQPMTQVVYASPPPAYVEPVYVEPAPVSTVVYIGGSYSYATHQRLSPYWTFPRPSYSYSTHYYGNYYGRCAPRFSVNTCYGGGFRGGFGGHGGFHR